MASRHLAHILATLGAPADSETTTLAADSATTSADSATPSARVGEEPGLPLPAAGSSSPTIRADDDGVKDVEMTVSGGLSALAGGSMPAPAPVQLVWQQITRHVLTLQVFMAQVRSCGWGLSH